MSNPYRDLGIPAPREPMFMEVALKKAKEKHMTQAERTEAVISSIQRGLGSSDIGERVQAGIKIESHARDLARKLDAVKSECDRWLNPTADAIAAIVEAE